MTRHQDIKSLPVKLQSTARPNRAIFLAQRCLTPVVGAETRKLDISRSCGTQTLSRAVLVEDSFVQPFRHLLSLGLVHAVQHDAGL